MSIVVDTNNAESPLHAKLLLRFGEEVVARRRLDVADVQVEADGRTLLCERKTWADFAKSITDGRWHEQKARLLSATASTSLHRDEQAEDDYSDDAGATIPPTIVYLIEGPIRGWWGNVGGLQFFLETQARENRSAYQQILRTSWVGLAKDEDPAPYAGGGGARIYAEGGLWSALSVYMQKVVANESVPMNRTLPAPDPSGNKIDAALAYRAEPPAPPPAASTRDDGTIEIPAVSFSSKNRSAPVSVMKSFLEGTQLLSNGCTSSVGPPCFDPPSSAVTYEVTAKAAGSYYLTANFSTWHMVGLTRL